MTSVSTNVTSIISSHFPFDDDFCAFGPNLSKGRHDQIYAIRFISVLQASSAITANFVLNSWFSRSDEFMRPLSTMLSLGAIYFNMQF